jgi:hypothetical protein
MTAKERKKLHDKGIFTVTQLSYTFRPRRRPKRLRDKREKYSHSLRALAIRQKKIHLVGSPEVRIEGTPVYLDVEGLPDRDFYYLIGVRLGNRDAVGTITLLRGRFATLRFSAKSPARSASTAPVTTSVCWLSRKPAVSSENLFWASSVRN